MVNYPNYSRADTLSMKSMNWKDCYNTFNDISQQEDLVNFNQNLHHSPSNTNILNYGSPKSGLNLNDEEFCLPVYKDINSIKTYKFDDNNNDDTYGLFYNEYNTKNMSDCGQDNISLLSNRIQSTHSPNTLNTLLSK